MHHDVDVMRRFLKLLKPKDKTSNLLDIVDISTNNNLDYRSVEIYNYVLKDNESIAERIGNWVQEFYKIEDILTYIQTQFSAKEFIMNLINKQKEVENGK